MTLVGNSADDVWCRVADPSLEKNWWAGGKLAPAQPRHSDPMPPGVYVLSVFGRDICAQGVPFTIRAGADTPVEVRVHAGVRQRVELVLPEPRDETARIGVRVWRGADPVQWAGAAARAGEACVLELFLAPGRYTLVADAGAREGRGECVVGDEEGEPLRLELR